MSNATTTTTLSSSDTGAILDKLAVANKAFTSIYPGEIADRQPVHTVYGGAQLFRPDRTVRMGKSCLLYTSPSPRDLSTSRMPSSA